MKNVVVMFPYPSGKGLHIGHYYNYAIVDSFCRWWRYMGEAVNQPFGYDAFGLPAENYAREIGGDPHDITYENIGRFRKQMDHMNTMYQERLITSDPSYIKWTQWLFLKLKEHGLAYKDWKTVPYCPKCETVLANEQLVAIGRPLVGSCERCRTHIQYQNLHQWFFKITDYKDRLIKNLDHIDYPESTIKKQRNWLADLHDWCVSRQRKWGCPIPVKGEVDTLDTFVDSSFYYLRYTTDSNAEFLPKDDYRPVDLYIGGPEHACMHLIYARFVHMFLYDIGVVPQEEPFNKVIHQGMITHQGSKMAKSKGNVVDPGNYDPDELRLYLMFIGPYEDGGEWNDSQIVGIRRFLKRLRTKLENASPTGKHVDLSPYKKMISQSIKRLKPNLIVSGLMKMLNSLKNDEISLQSAQEIREMMSCFAPTEYFPRKES